jgi:hypothetical protein
MLFRLARRAGFIDHNPARGLTARLESGVRSRKRQKVGIRKRDSLTYSSESQTRAMIWVASELHRVVLRLAGDYGVSAAEMRRLGKDAISYTQGTLTIPPGTSKGFDAKPNQGGRPINLQPDMLADFIRLEVVRRARTASPMTRDRLLDCDLTRPIHQERALRRSQG